METTTQGPQSGFSESLPTNLGLIRQRYPSTTLTVESMTIGTTSQTKVMILHDTQYVDPVVLKE
ncbi:spore germination protein [Heyndrickxia sporothermodurans]|uniref:spore germination protein n=1 Tax=Heyndrickxia sporothermodurans TaxID=46224 RepID=UPI00368DD26C